MLFFQADIRSGSGGRWGAVTGPKGVRHDTGDSRNRSRRKCLWGHGLGSPVALLAGARRPLATPRSLLLTSAHYCSMLYFFAAASRSS